MTSSIDTWTSDDVKRLLREKYLLIIGDLVMKHLYQDVVKFFSSNTFLTDEESNQPTSERRFSGDHLIRPRAPKDHWSNGTVLEEVREFTAGGQVKIRFYFVSRCFSSYVKDSIISDIQSQVIKPDLIVMNSCLWDLSQSGFDAMESYKNGLDHLFNLVRQILPETPFFWIAALPVSNKSEGEMIDAFLRPIVPGLIRDGNAHCLQLCPKYKILYIDVHSSFLQLLHLRHPNGIYWKPVAYRLLTEILLNHFQAFCVGVSEFRSRSLQNDLERKITTYKRQLGGSSPARTVRPVQPATIPRQGLLATIAKNVKRSLEQPVMNKRKRDDDEEEERKENERPANLKMVKIEHEYDEKPQIPLHPPSPPPVTALVIEPCHDSTFDDESDALGITFGPGGDDSHVEPPAEPKDVGPDLIVLSSDDDDAEILPIYLLNRRVLGIRCF